MKKLVSATSAVDEQAASARRRPPNTSRHDESQRLLQLRMDFAQALTKRNGKALLIRRDNKGDGWRAIPEAVASGRAYAVEVADDVLAIDVDCLDHAAPAHVIAEKCRALHASPVLIASGQPGRFHVFARIDDRVAHTKVVREAKALGLTVRRTIRPPLAPHRLGHAPSLIEPQNPLEALARLRRPTPARLSPRMTRLLVVGDVDGRYPSRSEVVHALACAAHQAGWSWEDFEQALLDRANCGGAKAQELHRVRGRVDAARYLRLSWQRAREYLRTEPSRSATGASAIATRVQHLADHRAWPGKAGSTDRAVLAAHLAIAITTNKRIYYASVREVAEHAGISVPTAVKSHRRLMESGWLRRLRIGVGHHASLWRLELPRNHQAADA